MSDPRYQRTAARILIISAGLLLIAGGIAIELFLTDAVLPPVALVLFIALGGLFLAAGVLLPGTRWARGATRAALVTLAAIGTIVLSECFLRLISYDFHRQDEFPVYYRPPTYDMGGGVLRRTGPTKWKGRALTEFMRVKWGETNVYSGEAPVEISYDRFGFRNPQDMADWEIVVAGDSFIELGFVPYEQTITSIASRRLGLRIKSLGVSGTGPIFQTAYLKAFGKARSTTDAVLAFFDGNDVLDLRMESKHTNAVYGPRYIPDGRQSSLIVAMCEMARRSSSNSTVVLSVPTNAFLLVGTNEYPATLESPPTWEEMTAREKALVASAMTNWATTARSLGLRPWVMCIPDRHRVFYGRLRYIESESPAAHWKYGVLAPKLAEICAAIDVQFIDATPVLEKELSEGRIPYNLLGDTHINTNGARAIGELLASRLRIAGLGNKPL